MACRDQELRFTVHDSPDYYQLKVSVFNDDKKTELVGECWVALDSIIVRGGAQNDIWHNLNCKGRYAGEIRIELTYYDTRPRDNKVEERRQSTQAEGTPEPGREGIGGPRQPKPVKRRPLPADPTGLTRPVSLPASPPTQQDHHHGSLQQQYVEPPNENHFYTPPKESQHQQIQDPPSRGMPSDYRYPSQDSYQITPPAMAIPGLSPSVQERTHPTPMLDFYGQQNDPLHSQSPEAYDQGLNYEQGSEADTYNPTNSSQGNVYPASTPPATPHHYISAAQPLRTAPGVLQSRDSPRVAATQNYHSSSLSQSVVADVSPTSAPSRHNSQEAWSDSQQNLLYDEAPPPPPPAHRMSNSRAPPQINGYYVPQMTSFAATPAPLNIRNDRGSISGSPLAQANSIQPDREYEPSASPSNSQRFSHSASPISSQTSYTQAGHRISPMRDVGQSMPPSLVPGYEPSIAADESDRILREQRMSARQDHASPQRPLHHPDSAPVVQSRHDPLLRDVDTVQESKAHRNSAHIIKPRAVHPDPRTPMRKPVSPRPSLAPGEQSRPELPFSPDSFNAFNPNIDSADEINQIGARYDTPDKAREASIQHDRDVKRGDGPIIGNDGRVIDPSDHLPTDTWAPEPEQKKPRKGPEVTLRFRHSPQGAQPMPATGRRPLSEARPNAMSSPTYASSANISPGSAERSRLQKKSRLNMAQPASSPIVPTLKTSTPPRGAMSRSSATDYPLREHEDHGYRESSPSYGDRSHGGLPPPIPGKVPIGSGQEDWGRDALSEEMSRIDIGVGSGHRTRARRYGF